MYVVNRSGVWGVLLAAALAWLPVFIFDGGAVEYFAGFVFFASAYASWTDRWPLEIRDPASGNPLDWPDPPGMRVAVFGTVPLLHAPFLGVVVVLGYLCFTGFERSGYLLRLYLGVFVAAVFVAAVTVGRRNFVFVHDESRFDGGDGRTTEPNG